MKVWVLKGYHGYYEYECSVTFGVIQSEEQAARVRKNIADYESICAQIRSLIAQGEEYDTIVETLGDELARSEDFLDQKEGQSYHSFSIQEFELK